MAPLPWLWTSREQAAQWYFSPCASWARTCKKQRYWLQLKDYVRNINAGVASGRCTWIWLRVMIEVCLFIVLSINKTRIKYQFCIFWRYYTLFCCKTRINLRLEVFKKYQFWIFLLSTQKKIRIILINTLECILLPFRCLRIYGSVSEF